jgi:HEPN domain-containing protein
VIDDAEALLDEGRTDEAVITIYEAVRAELVDTYELLPGLTHWELLDRLQSSGGEQVGESVVGLTTAYERAAYAPDTVEADEATAALETAKRLLSQTDQFL